jgi:hypothetical protein
LIYRTGCMIWGVSAQTTNVTPHWLGSQIPGLNPLARTTTHTSRLQLAIVSGFKSQ